MVNLAAAVVLCFSSFCLPSLLPIAFASLGGPALRCPCSANGVCVDAMMGGSRVEVGGGVDEATGTDTAPAAPAPADNSSADAAADDCLRGAADESFAPSLSLFAFAAAAASLCARRSLPFSRPFRVGAADGEGCGEVVAEGEAAGVLFSLPFASPAATGTNDGGAAKEYLSDFESAGEGGGRLIGS